MSSTRPNTHRYVVYLPYIEKGRARPFRVSEDADVQDLINEICQYTGYKNALDNQIVDLYKCGSLKRKPLESLYGRALDWLRGHAGDGGEKTPLDPADRLNEYFPEGPTPEHEKMVDVIAMVGSTVVPAKRSRPSEESPFEFLKRSKVANMAPSSFATPSVYEKNQETGHRILDDRPHPDTDVPPIALLYAGFGRFIDIYRGDEEAPALSREDAVRFEMAVDEFAEKMTCFYNREESRRDVAITILNRILPTFAGPVRVAASAVSENQQSDGDIRGKDEIMLFVEEIKNHSCASKTDPMVQGIGYIASKLKTVMEGDERLRDLIGRSRLPSLGLTIAGPYIAFYAVIFLGGKFRVVNLTATLSCVRSACDGHDRKGLYAAFTAASVLVGQIKEDIRRLDEGVLVNQHADILFPYIHSLPKYNDCTNTMLNFRIAKWHDDRRDSRLLYIAETDDKEEIIVKFVRQYSIDLHKFCADSGHAPKIRGFAKLPGGWHVVAMDYYPIAVPILCAQKLSDRREQWASELQHLVDSFHETDFVHGDLRDANIICANEEIMLVDFDWGGRSGEACYPTVKLNPELTDGRRETDLKIRIVDDNRVLEKTLKKIRGV